MVKSIESYIAETTNSYDPAIKAYNQQIAGLSDSKASDLANLERSHASGLENLDRQKNRAAETASLAAASRGGAFGGASNIARRNYYQDTFVPAVTQLNSNKASAEESLNKQYAEQQRNLESQLANLYAQANTYGTQRYDDALKQAEAQRQYNQNLAFQKAQQQEAIRQFNANQQEATRQYNQNLALQQAKQDEAIRQYNESLALQKAQQAEAIRQFNENLALERAKLEESKRQASASQAASNSWVDYYNKAISSANQNQNQASNNITGRRTAMYGGIPVQQVQVNGQWVNENDYAKTASNTAKSTINSILGKLMR